MREKRKKIQPVVDLLEYMIRWDKISNEGGHKIYAAVLKEPDLPDRVMDILDLELSEQETIAKVEKLLWYLGGCSLQSEGTFGNNKWVCFYFMK